MVRRALLTISAVCLVVLMNALPSAQSANGVRVVIQDGRVTLSARQASLSAILAEWARVGQSTIVNGDAVSPTPITVEFSDVSEQQALQILLRSTGGFVAVPRSGDAGGASAFARIVILPASGISSNSTAIMRSSASPPPAAAPAPAIPQPIATQTPGVTRLIGANGLPVPDDQDDGPPPGINRAPAGYISGGDPPPRPLPPSAATPTQPTRIPSGTLGSAAPGVITPVPPTTPAAPPSSGSTPQR
jgi:hypothetical protein